jgi:hypothetical protein
MSPLRIGSLADLERKRTPEIYVLDELPKIAQWTTYAKAKANAISSLVREMYGSSYEWYGFTIGHSSRPQLIVDIGLGENARNDHAYTKIEPEQIGKFCDSLPDDYLINGWIHSHGTMGVFFSGTDERNHLNVLDFVTTRVKTPVKKQELLIENLTTLVNGEFTKSELKEGTLTVITEKPAGKVKLLETIMGGFAYGMVIIDSGNTGQDIWYKYTSMLTQQEKITHRDNAEIRTVYVDAPFGVAERLHLKEEVKKKIKPDFFGGIWGIFKGAPNYQQTNYNGKPYSNQPAAAGKNTDCKAIVVVPTPGLNNTQTQATLDNAVTPTPGEAALDPNQIKNQPDEAAATTPATPAGTAPAGVAGTGDMEPGVVPTPKTAGKNPGNNNHDWDDGDEGIWHNGHGNSDLENQ